MNLQKLDDILFKGKDYGIKMNYNEHQNSITFYEIDKDNNKKIILNFDKNLNNTEESFAKAAPFLAWYQLKDNFPDLSTAQFNSFLSDHNHKKFLDSENGYYYETLKKMFINLTLSQSINSMLKSEDLSDIDVYEPYIEKIKKLHNFEFEFHKSENENKIDNITLHHPNLKNNFNYQIKNNDDFTYFLNDFVNNSFELESKQKISRKISLK